MKSSRRRDGREAVLSHPARGAWIEMYWTLSSVQEMPSHPARGAWIEIWDDNSSCEHHHSRTPQGVRGLKLADDVLVVFVHKSHPARGAWIEMQVASRMTMLCHVAPRKGCVD